MKKIMMVLPLLSSMAFADAPTVAGTWNLDCSVSGVEYTETCSLTVDDDHKVAGTCNLNDVEYKVTGSVDGKSVQFTHGGDYQGEAITLAYHGSFGEDGSFSGSVDVTPMNASGDFKAKKATPPKAE